VVGLVNEFHAVVRGSGMRHANAQFKRAIAKSQEDRSAGICGKRVTKFEPHSLVADVFASSWQGRLLNSELDGKINGESWRSVLEPLHTHPRH
jgi:hypothetical protein